MHNTFSHPTYPYSVIGEPVDVPAPALAVQNRHQFEYWALGMVGARPAQDKKKGTDRGVDGIIHFSDDQAVIFRRAYLRVKSGRVAVSRVRDLKGVRHKGGYGRSGHP